MGYHTFLSSKIHGKHLGQITARLYSGMQKTSILEIMFFLASDEDLPRQVAAVHHLKIVLEGTLKQWVPFDLLVVCM